MDFKRPFFFLICLGFFGCSGLEHSQYTKIRKENAVEEKVLRTKKNRSYQLTHPKKKLQVLYPWQEAADDLPKITKEYFRCKGSFSNPPYKGAKGKIHKDCKGKDEHSLPLKDGKEMVYPILIDLLNYVQKKTGKKVRITSGHRCPTHNTYSDPSKFNQGSKHQIGAEVDFYVEGMELSPTSVIDLLLAYYKEHPKTKHLESYTHFYRYRGKGTNVKEPPWYNKEVFIKLYQQDEGRDLDNQHPYPYIGVQVRFDRKTNKTVSYSWEKAYKGLFYR